MPARGRLIAVCGIDGSGKTVQTGLLARRARKAGWRVETIEFPRYEQGFFGKLIARYLRGEFSRDPGAVDPYLASLPFACDRWQAAPALKRWLSRGAMVVCNRYVSANLAHQGGKIRSPRRRREFLRWIEQLEYEVFGLPRPDVQVWLDMPPAVAVRLIARKKRRRYLRQAKDIHESSLAHLEGTRRAYRELASGRNWFRVACARKDEPRAPEEIAEEIWDGVRRRLAKGRRRGGPPARGKGASK